MSGPATVRDTQRARLYAWEAREVAPRVPGAVAWEEAQRLVDGIWSEQGLRHPPRVERLPRQCRRTLATGDRLTLRLPARVPAWCLLHEVAHALASTADGASDGHGPRFLGLYVRLLARYARLDAAALLAAAALAGLRADADARPAFA